MAVKRKKRTPKVDAPVSLKRRKRKSRSGRPAKAPSELDMEGLSDVEMKIAEMCKDTGTPMPLEFLTKIMGGQDPRKNSHIYKHLLQIEAQFGPGVPPPEGSWHWDDMVEMIKNDYQEAPVSLQESQSAAKQVAEYVHSKKRNIQVHAEVTNIDVTPLTAREIILFQEKFDGRY